jgi:hypothetical protein
MCGREQNLGRPARNQALSCMFISIAVALDTFLSGANMFIHLKPEQEREREREKNCERRCVVQREIEKNPILS